jgi:hypothetical protein
MISYQKKFIRIVECWNDEVPQTNGADIIRRFQQAERASGRLCREFHTVLIDLTRAPEQIFEKIKRGTRYEIRRALSSDDLTHSHWNGAEQNVFSEFCAYAEEFLTDKRQPKLDRDWLALLAKAGSLELTRIDDVKEQRLVWHAYHRGRERVTLLYSASLFRQNPSGDFRNMIGRANRLQHWLDMLHFKKEGIATYDFGGWYHGSQDEERLRINKFKQQFGGQVVKNYICEEALTLKGRLFLKIRSALLGDAI